MDRTLLFEILRSLEKGDIEVCIAVGAIDAMCYDRKFISSTEVDYYRQLEKVCNELIDEIEKGNTPKHQFNGLKILMNRL